MKWPWSKTILYKQLPCNHCNGSGRTQTLSAWQANSTYTWNDSNTYKYAILGICSICCGYGYHNVIDKVIKG